MSRSLKTVGVYEKTKEKSDYIGSVSTLTLVREIKAIPSPVTDKAAVEMYGERVTGMLSVTSTDKLIAGNVLKIGESFYKVVSVSEYSDHYTAVCERTDTNAD